MRNRPAEKRFWLVVCLLGVTAGLSCSLPAVAETCSCSLGECSASITCAGGCSAICSASRCEAYCSGGGFGEEYKTAPVAGALDQRISVDAAGVTATELATMITRNTGIVLAIVPQNPAEQLWLEVKDMPLREVLLTLAPSGLAGILAGPGQTAHKGQDDRLGAHLLSLAAQTAKSESLAAFVQQISAGRATFVPRQPGEIISSQVKDFPFAEWLQRLAKFGEVALDGKRILALQP